MRLREGEGASVCTLESCHMGLTAQEVAQKFLRISIYTEYAHQIVHRGVCTPNSPPTQCVPEERSPKAACKASSYSVILRLHSHSLVSVQFSFPEDYTVILQQNEHKKDKNPAAIA